MPNAFRTPLTENIVIMLRSFWAKPLMAIIAAVFCLTLTLVLDRAGLSIWLGEKPWPLSMSGETAKEATVTLAGIITALLALFFSITLIVLTMASSSLGIRLVDRWIANRTIQTTLSLLLALLVFSILLIGAVDPNGPDDRIPRLSVLTLMMLLVLTVPWLAYAFHHLSRRIHVDTSIVDIGEGLQESLSKMGKFPLSSAAPETGPAHRLGVLNAAYLEHINIDKLVKICTEHKLRIRMMHQEGDFLLQNDTLLEIWPEDVSPDITETVRKAVTMGGFRTDRQGARFRTNLLAEIAARAMSPAVNDYYTAFACIDQLGGAMAPFLSEAKNGDWIVDCDGHPIISLYTRLTKSILENPLRIIRHSVAPYPAVALYEGQMLSRLIDKCAQTEDKDFLKRQLSQLVRAALEHVVIDEDKQNLEALLK